MQIEHGSSEAKEKRQEYHAKLAGLYMQLDQTAEAKKHLSPLLHGALAYSDDKQRLHAACQMADAQVCTSVIRSTSAELALQDADTSTAKTWHTGMLLYKA